MGAKHQKLLLGNNAPSAVTSTCNISSALAPLSRKNPLSQHFFLQKSKTCHEIIETNGGKTPKTESWASTSAFRPTCNISSALAPLSRKNSLRHFFMQKSKTWNQANGGKTPKTNPGQQCLWQVTATPTCDISSALAPLSRKNSLSTSQAFFHTKIKNTVMKPLNIRTNGGKTPKTTPGQQCPKGRHVHMQHFFSPSPAIEKKFAESAFFHTKTVEFTSQWGQNTKTYSWATMPLVSAVTPTCDISSALAPLSRNNSLS